MNIEDERCIFVVLPWQTEETPLFWRPEDTNLKGSSKNKFNESAIKLEKNVRMLAGQIVPHQCTAFLDQKLDARCGYIDQQALPKVGYIG